MKKTVITLKYTPTGEAVKWRLWREPSMIWYRTGHKPKRIASWCWEDETGYIRCGPETWKEFVPYLRQYFDSYAMKPTCDFS
jgi:hypothetical protein